jgi:hypothetical protein
MPVWLKQKLFLKTTLKRELKQLLDDDTGALPQL